MPQKRKGISLLLAILFTASVSMSALAIQVSDIKQVVPIGHTTGIKLFSDGVIVAGVTPIETKSGQKNPCADAGIVQGDIIVKINDKKVTSNEAFRNTVKQNGKNALTLTVLRDKQEQNIKINPVCDTDGDYKIGLWIRDSMAGIGTITFYDPQHKFFGALGHGICDSDSNILIPFGSGSVMESSVIDVKKGVAGTPGELIGNYNLQEDYGTLFDNTNSGIFGEVTSSLDLAKQKPIPIAKKEETKVGPAVILSNIEGNNVEEYQIEIIKVYPQEPGETKNMMIRVTDKRLIEKTGGIVQGMGVIDNRDNTKKPVNNRFSAVTLKLTMI